MLLGLLAALVLAPIYWLAVPTRWRREVLSAVSLLALSLFDWRLVPLLLAVTLAVAAALHLIAHGPAPQRRILAAGAIALLVALFVWNKEAGHSLAVLPSQGGVVFLGVSFLVLKAVGAIIECARGALRPALVRDLLAWLVFLPTYPSGPMESLDHFRDQWSAWDRRRALGGLERILFGLVKTLVFAHALGVWIDPILAAPEQVSPPLLLVALYALALRFYFDLAGYSDVAIGLAAIYGYDIAENFDRPFAARNIALLWQRWHMTLTGWLRRYTFTPLTRALMRRAGRGGDRLAVAIGLLATLLLIGLWHGIRWNFVVYGLLQGMAVIWVSVLARDTGRRLLSPPLLRWWRTSRVGYGLSVWLTLTFFSVTGIFIITDVAAALRYLRALVGA